MKLFVCLAFLSLVVMSLGYETAFAVNFGDAGELTDSNNFKYSKDTTSYNKTTIASNVTGVAEKDQKLYQSYVWDPTKLSLDVPVQPNGKYLLIVKTFNNETPRRMNVVINGEITIALAPEAGNFSAYDEQIFFSICNQQLLYKTQKTVLKQPNINIQFQNDNSSSVMVSAMAVLKGTTENLPIPMPNKVSRVSELSQVYQNFAHTCESDVPKVVAQNGTEKSAGAVVAAAVPELSKIFPKLDDRAAAALNFIFSNFTFSNLNIFTRKSENGAK
jgi:hypothetical protein